MKLIGRYLIMSITNFIDIVIGNKKIIYIPMAMQYMLYQKRYKQSPFINEPLVEDIFMHLDMDLDLNFNDETEKEILYNDKYLIIFDFKNITMCTTDMYEIFANIFKLRTINNDILFANVSNRTVRLNLKQFLNEYDYNLIFKNEENAIHEKHFINFLEPTEDVNEKYDFINNLVNECDIKIKECIKEICFTRDEVDQHHYLSNSNIYIKHYFDVKKLLGKSKFTAYALYCLCAEIRKYILSNNNINEEQCSSDEEENNIGNSFGGLVCTSYNGAVLATMIGELINQKVIYMLNIGPKLSLKDVHDAEKIKKDKKYIYIFDFMCIGTEYKIIQSIVRLRGAKMNQCLGVGVFKEPNRKSEKIDVITKIEEDEGTSLKQHFYSLIKMNKEEYEVSFD